ncbi:PIN domain-containing protein [Candidatus Pyrohabitans sp.]
MKLQIVVDANPIISALIGGASREVFFRRTFKFATSEYTLKEVRKFIL